MDSTLNSNNFFDWFTTIGGCVTGYSQINDNQHKPKQSNLKNKAAEIKEKYNHKFKFRNENERD